MQFIKNRIFHFLIVLFTLLLVVTYSFFFYSEIKADVFGQFEWINHDLSGTGHGNARSTATDSQGNVYVVGYLDGTADLGAGSWTADETDYFILKFDSDGDFLWGDRRDSGNSYDSAYGVAVDEEDNVIVAGTFQSGTLDVGEGPWTPSGITDYFVVKYDSDGNFLWGDTQDGGTGAVTVTGVATDFGENIYVAGSFNSGTVDFGLGAMTPGGTTDYFVIRYTETGTFEWVQRETGDGDAYAGDVTTDPSGNVIVSGAFGTDDVDFGDGTVTLVEDAVLFTVKFTGDGNFVWLYTSEGGENDVSPYSNETDSSGNVYVGGYFQDTRDFGSGTLTSYGQDYFLLKLNSSGVFQWVDREADDNSGSQVQGVAVDNGDNVYITGIWNGDADFGTGTITAVTTDFFVLKYNSNGVPQWVYHKAGGNATIYSFEISVDQDGGVYTTGFFGVGGGVDFGGGEVTPGGVFDFFLLKLSDQNDESYPLRIVLRDSENPNTISDVEVWFDTPTNITAGTIIIVTYDPAFTGGSLIGTADVTATCDADGLDPIAGTTMLGVVIENAADGYLRFHTGGSTCSKYIVLDINGADGNDLTNPTSSGNYSWSVNYDASGDESIEFEQAALAYVANENDVEVTANVPPVIDFDLYEAGSDTLLSPNSCSLGILSINTVGSCVYDIGTGTNNASGLTVNIISDGNLRTGGAETIDACGGTNCNGDGTAGVTAGSEEYGIQITDLGGGEYTAAGSFGTADQSIPTTATAFATSSSIGNGTQSGQAAQRLEITHRAGVGISTTQGSYSHLISYLIFTN